MNRITETTIFFFALLILFLSAAANRISASPGGDLKMTISKRGNDMTIACPTQISYRIETIADWEAGFHGIKLLVLEDATANGRILTCNYEAKGPGKDSSMLTRSMPAGYVCKSESVYGAKTWSFVCKRAVAPIKIKPKS